jgi:hypothetical protein
MSKELSDYLLGAAFNLAVAVVIVRFIYYPTAQNKSYVFAFLVFNTVIYFLMSMLRSIELSIGVGFGLFAIFTVLRYRTEEIPIREITYLFITIALPVMNSAIGAGEGFAKLAVANGATVVLLYVLEREWGFRFEASKRVTYERIELITPDKTDLLLADLRERTGLDVKRVEIGRIDFLRDTAELRAYYDVPVAAAVRGQRQEPLSREARLSDPAYSDAAPAGGA